MAASQNSSPVHSAATHVVTRNFAQDPWQSRPRASSTGPPVLEHSLRSVDPEHSTAGDRSIEQSSQWTAPFFRNNRERQLVICNQCNRVFYCQDCILEHRMDDYPSLIPVCWNRKKTHPPAINKNVHIPNLALEGCPHMQLNGTVFRAARLLNWLNLTRNVLVMAYRQLPQLRIVLWQFLPLTLSPLDVDFILALLRPFLGPQLTPLSTAELQDACAHRADRAKNNTFLCRATLEDNFCYATPTRYCTVCATAYCHRHGGFANELCRQCNGYLLLVSKKSNQLMCLPCCTLFDGVPSAMRHVKARHGP